MTHIGFLPAANGRIRKAGLRARRGFLEKAANRQIGEPANPSRSLSWLMAHGLDVVAVRIEDEGAVIVLVVVGPRTRRAVVAAARPDRGAVERIDLGVGLRREGDMSSALGLRASADPEERLSVDPETGAA